MPDEINTQPPKKTRKFPHAEHWDNVFNKEFNKESDRAAVILAASIFDNVLTELLKNHLVSNATTKDDLFDSANAPLSTFSAKITMAHRLGLHSSTFTRDLHLIRKIRNEFAHNIHGCTFEDSRVKSRTLELYKSTGNIIKDKYRSHYPEGPRGDFMFICMWMLWKINCAIEDCKQLHEPKAEFGYKE